MSETKYFDRVEGTGTEGFVIKDSGERKVFESGMMRDTSAGKVDYLRVFEGPMFKRWAAHLTKGAAKYPDLPDGHANWTLANGHAELRRFKASAVRHFIQWIEGEEDEDHAAAVIFNINGAEYVKGRINAAAGIAARERADDALRHQLERSLTYRQLAERENLKEIQAQTKSTEGGPERPNSGRESRPFGGFQAFQESDPHSRSTNKS